MVTKISGHLDEFSPEQQIVLKPLLQRPSLQTSMVSPFGFFRIHYDTTGYRIPSYISNLTIEQNVMKVAEALDSAYRFEVEFLSFPHPPPDNNEGGDDLYDVYIEELGRGYYGYTDPEVKVGNTNWSSFMVIDNNYYEGYYSSGLSGAQVTVAHEFHHAIQVGNYAYSEGVISPVRDGDSFFYEITSTSMEEFVFDDINDYYAYISGYTDNPARDFTRNNVDIGDGYDLAIWNIYILEFFGAEIGFEIIKQQWELMPTYPAIISINNIIVFHNSTFAREYNRFGIWIYYTAYRAVDGKYFEEGENYPLVRPISTIPYSPPLKEVVLNTQRRSNNFVRFNNVTNGDTLYAIITNGDIFSAGSNLRPVYTLYSDSSLGSRKLTENYSSDFSVSNPSYWSVSEILNDQVIRVDSSQIMPPSSNGSFAFPNPFSYTEIFAGFEPVINISLEGSSGTTIDFNVYSGGMLQVYSSSKIVKPLINNSVGITWNGKDNDDNKLATGIYIYIIKNGDDVIKGKVVIFNE